MLYGCVFRKVYLDPISKKPVSRFINPEDFLFDNNCSNINESNRLTHIRYLSKREILFNIQNDIFLDSKLPYLRNNADIENQEDEESQEQKQIEPTNSRFTFYETHEYLNLTEFFDDYISNEGNNIPLPYVITRCKITNNIVSIVPNWQEDDPTKTRINCFVHYNLFPGFDIYGLGLAQILGSNAKSLTIMQQMAIDATVFQNFPGGIKEKGLKTNETDFNILPGEFVTVTTRNLALRDAIMPLPYNGPSPAMAEYLNRITEQYKELASTTETGISENSQNTPVGTTIALLEVATRMQSAILRTIHTSFSQELQIFYRMFNPNVDIKGGIKVIPVSDPSVESSTQRIMKAESLLKIASGAPELHDMRAVYNRVYEALGIADISKILLPEQAEDIESETMAIDPALQVQAADIEQRKLEVESKERLAYLNIESDGYKTQKNIDLEIAKMENERYIAELKAQESEIIARQKNEIELLKIQLNTEGKITESTIKAKENEDKNELELLKLDLKAKEAALKADTDIVTNENQKGELYE